MKKNPMNLKDFIALMADWQSTETDTMEYVKKELPKTKNLLIKTVLRALKLEAEKRCIMLQMVIESAGKEAVNLDPEELQTLSAHINRQIETEEKALPNEEKALETSELFLPSYILSYLIADLKKENELLTEFDDALKSAAIPTSAGYKRSK
jgi:hypothetical protein